MLLSLGLLLSFGAYAQKSTKVNKKKYLKAADDALKSGNIFGAADLYQQVLKDYPDETSFLFNLAQAYFLARDYESAASWFEKAYEADSLTNTVALYYDGIATKMQGKYPEAINLFRRFSKVYKGNDAVKMRKWARTEIDGCNFAINESKPDPSVKLTHLGLEVNSNYGDMAPVLDGDTLFFSSVRAAGVIEDNKEGGKSDSAVVKLFYSTLNGDAYNAAERFTQIPQHGKYISNPDFNDDGTKMYYTLCDVSFIKPRCDIYVSERKDGQWQDGKILGEEVNAKGFTNTQPCYVHTPSGDVLYFVSDREGGGSRGGLDIWYCTVNKKGDFGTARNAGPHVNTDRDEVTPFYDTKTRTLYFASDGWISMGGRDIFKTAGETGHFTGTPENLGAPFNSACDDYNFRFGKATDKGYLVSNRPGIFSVRGKTCCDDIFEYKYEHQIYLAVKGRVFDDSTKQPIAGAAINLSLRSANPGENDVVINTDTSNAETPYLFNLKAENLYKVTGIKEGYFTASQTFSTEGITKSDTQVVDIYMKKLEKNKAYRLNNIYYDFDKSDLRPESKATLDSLYNILIENPTIVIELSSHTDQRGSDQYNLDLSQKRAESCVNYLVHDKGIPKERITAKGYGKTKPLQDCTKVDGCPMDQSADCPCHQLNRRTEFKIIGELKGELIYDNE
ncbi:MAG TPA: OmpA family protein [Chitinophagales bacterium]|nr:OmpA family protein [Chitinophagales bacterium]